MTTTSTDPGLAALDDREHRLRCLDLAIRTEPTAGFQAIVAGAQRFYAFVSADDDSSSIKQPAEADEAAAESTTAQKGS